MDEAIKVMLPIQLDAAVHDRESFDCGVLELNRFLKEKARKESDNNLSKTFVMCVESNPSQIVGYYSLSSSRIAIDDLPESLKKKLPRYNYIGVTLLGRLAVAKEFSHAQSPGLRAGELLLSDAKLRSYIASKTVASYAVIVDILIGEKGDPTNFYKRYDFVEFPSNPRKLYLPMATVEKTVNKAGLI